MRDFPWHVLTGVSASLIALFFLTDRLRTSGVLKPGKILGFLDAAPARRPMVADSEHIYNMRRPQADAATRQFLYR
jgi:hypothetical protein